jgi:DNA-binding XRE family transcriptional regulator
MAVRRKSTKFEEFEAELLNNQEIRKEYDALKPKYEMIRRLIEQRIKLRMSQAELAKKVGMRQPAICRLETGDYNTTLSTFFKVTQALDLDIELCARTTGARVSRISPK